MLEKLIQRRPILTAAALYALVVAVVFWPVWTGQFLASEHSDILRGLPPRAFAAAYFKAHGAFPEWDPHIFGGMPYLANTSHGDTFYPTFLLRLVFPVHVGISLGFVIHIMLAGTFMFLFLRALRLEWGAAFVGGSAYMFTGQVVSMVSPGHDGKLFVSALLPLALMFLYQAVARGDWRRYLGFGVVVGFALLSPHFQMTYYLLMAAGFFWLFLMFFDRGEQAVRRPWWQHTGLFAAGLGVGFAVAAIQLVPFMAYIPFTPRGEGGASRGWEHAISWSMPPEELINVLWPAFSGVLEDYWGRNFFKLHSEYLGVATLILATFGFKLTGRRRLAWFFVFLAAYGTLFALGGATPFYYLPYTLLPGIKLTRAPSSIFVVVSFAAAALAAMGTQALISSGATTIRRTPLIAWGVALGLGLLLAAAGFWEGIARALAPANHQAAVGPASRALVVDCVRVLVVGAAVIALVWQRLLGRLGGSAWALALGLVTLVDLWSAERHFIRFSPPPGRVLDNDQLSARLAGDTGVFRVVPGANYLGLRGIRSVMGYSGTELNRYDELLGRTGDDRRNLLHPTIWRLLGVRYVTLPDTFQVPHLSPADSQRLKTWDDPWGQGSVHVYRFNEAEPYSYLVPLAIKVQEEQQVPVILDPRFDPRRFLVVPTDAPVGESRITAMPEPIPVTVNITPVRAGSYQLELAAAAPAGSYLFFAENWHPGWGATVDGQAGQVLRAQHTLIGVPLAAGARRVELTFRDAQYPLGRTITLATLVLLVGVWTQGWWSRRQSREPARA